MMSQNHKNNNHAQSIIMCCASEDKIDAKTATKHLTGSHREKDGHSNNDEHDHSGEKISALKILWPIILSLIFLLTALYLDSYSSGEWFTGWIRIIWYVIAYTPVGLPVLKDAVVNISKGNIFSEFFLMGVATIGAFTIGEYPEGVTVMLFYAIGEVFQTLAVKKAKKSIKSLLDQRPDEVTVIRNNLLKTVKAETVEIDEIIRLKPGEKVGLDGILLSESATFNTAALTGESTPDAKLKGDSVLAGMININRVVDVKVTTSYKESKLSRILELVQNATSKKAPTELFIRKFAKVYTPIVVFAATAICFLPYFLNSNYQFETWLYRALVFLVISCPCALVISIPLGYFGGIGAASRNGILFKGSNFLDTLASIKHVVMDKTGTMTEGVFKVQDIVLDSAFNQEEILQMVNALESHTNHPIATAIQNFVGTVNSNLPLLDIEEIAGYGLKANVDGKELLVGNFKLMDKFSITYNMQPDDIFYTVIAVAYDKRFVGYLTIADSIKEDSQIAINKLKRLNVKTTMLSGDKTSVVRLVSEKLGIDNAFGDLLPEDKVNKIKEIKDKNETVAFVGDGINDAPVVALSDVGIAMGGLGSDATIETADVVIQDDKPSKIAVAIKIGKQTKKIVWQNITLAFVVKGIVLILGAGGVATMWEAVFADVGVALLAILNATRLQYKRF